MIDGKSGKSRETSFKKSVADFIDDNGVVCQVNTKNSLKPSQELNLRTKIGLNLSMTYVYFHDMENLNGSFFFSAKA